LRLIQAPFLGEMCVGFIERHNFKVRLEIIN